MLPKHNQISQLILEHKYKAAETVAIYHITNHPIDGQGWVLLGESLLRQNFGEAARLVFERAWLLDPEAKWVPMMNGELEKVPQGPDRPDISELLKVKKPSITATIIVKNEERCIERCLLSLIETVDEIVVVDSGSTDNTLSIVRKFPKVQLFQTEWADSFALLRNEALSHVTSEWVFWMDADEWLDREDSDNLHTVVGLYHTLQPIIPALHPCIINHINGMEITDYSVPRLFPMSRGLHFEGRIHEQIATKEEGIFTYNILHKPVKLRVHHDGYESAVKAKKDKMSRNVKLLQIMTEEDPTNPGWWYFLGRETMSLNQYDDALLYLHNTIDLGKLNVRFGRLPEVHMIMGRIYVLQNKLEPAEDCCHKALELSPDFPDAHFMLSQISMRRAQELLRKAMNHVNLAGQGFHTYRGTVSADHEIHDWKANALKVELLISYGKLSDAKQLLNQMKPNKSSLDFITKTLGFINQQQSLLSQ